MAYLPDLEYIDSAISRLEDYFQQDELCWQLGLARKGRDKELRTLTPGNLILAIIRINVDTLITEQRERALELIKRFEDIRSLMHGVWQDKCKLEYESRLSSWKTYLNNYIHDPDVFYTDYAREVRNRVILDLLTIEMEINSPKETESLSLMDDFLRIHFAPATFIWEAGLMTQFSQEDFWYLYGQLKPVL